MLPAVLSRGRESATVSNNLFTRARTKKLGLIKNHSQGFRLVVRDMRSRGQWEVLVVVKVRGAPQPRVRVATAPSMSTSPAPEMGGTRVSSTTSTVRWWCSTACRRGTA